MATPDEIADNSLPKFFTPATLANANPGPPAEKEKQYRLYNVSGQTLYVVNIDGTHCLPPGSHYDLPFAKISHHIKLMATRGFIKLFEKEEKTP
jgi:hypothetical protein